MKLPELEDLRPVGGKRVLVRCDFNVPLTGDVITDDLRIRLPIETLVWLLDGRRRKADRVQPPRPAEGQA